MARSSPALTVTLGALKAAVDERVNTGRYASASEVVRAGLRALEREEQHLDAWTRAKIRESLGDPRPSIPADAVVADLRARMATMVEAVDQEN